MDSQNLSEHQLLNFWLSRGKELPPHLKPVIERLSHQHSSGICLKNLDSPMMKQFRAAKDEVPDALLFFRMGDFYELFGIDAVIVSDICGLTLTSRDKSSENPVPMAGSPVVGYKNALKKCIAAGFKVAVCDQVEDPRLVKGIVKREITRIATPAVPGDLDDDELNSSQEVKFGCYLACVTEQKKEFTLAYVDVSTGEFRVTGQLNETFLIQELSTIQPKEILIPSALKQSINHLVKNIYHQKSISFNSIENWILRSEVNCKELFCEFFREVDIHKFGLSSFSLGLQTVCAILHYLKSTQKNVLKNIRLIQSYKLSNHLIIDDATRKHLDFFYTSSNEKRGSLYHFLNKCTTATGSRLLLRRLNYPYKSVDDVNNSLLRVEELVNNVGLLAEIGEVLRRTADLDRLLSKAAQKNIDPRAMAFLRETLVLLPMLDKTIAKRESTPLLKSLLCDHPAIIALEPLTFLLISALAQDPSPLFGKGGVIFQTGYSKKLDEIVLLTSNFAQLLENLEAKERANSQISTLKIGYTSVFGYYFEISKGKIAQAPKHFERKQTLANCERYVTSELKELEEKALNAGELRNSLEKELFEELRVKVLEYSEELVKASELIAQIDLCITYAQLSIQYGWCKPDVNNNNVTILEQSIHPIMAHLESSAEQFVPNDIAIGESPNSFQNSHGYIHLITGPNMAGKSTIMRQVAISQVLCQIGSYIPARNAEIGMVDRIFTRIGSADNALKNQSTFMVEMLETAHMLRFATSKSLLLLDEIGRGTSTFDGLSLAWAILEYLHDNIQARTLFSTHYHELNEVCEQKTNIVSMYMSVLEKKVLDEFGMQKNDIVFSRRYLRGTAGKSYGLHVAELAGIPQEILLRAAGILFNLEQKETQRYDKPINFHPALKKKRTEKKERTFEETLF